MLMLSLEACWRVVNILQGRTDQCCNILLRPFHCVVQKMKALCTLDFMNIDGL